MLRLATFLFLASAAGAQAATLTPTDNPNCVTRLEGVLERGDFEQIRDAAAALMQPDADDPEGSTNRLRVCLNSPGGSLLEATRLAALFSDKGYGTVIDDGDSCLSACAVLFMFGSHYLTGRTYNFNRRMHVNATLGFHRPDFALPEGGNYSSADVEKAFDIAIIATLEFVRLANRRLEAETKVYVPSDLIEQMFSSEGQDFYYITSVDQVGRWDIYVFGHQQPSVFSAREALTACHNLSNWTYRLSPEPIRIPRAHMDWFIRDLQRVIHTVDNPEVSYDDNPTVSYYMYTGPDYVNDRLLAQPQRSCMVSMDAFDGAVTVSACGGNNVASDAGPNLNRCGMLDNDLMRAVSPLSIYPSDLLLSQLSGWSAIITAEAAEIDALDVGAPQAWCNAVPGGVSRVINVNEFVNLRSAPGFQAEKIGQAGKHLVLEYAGQPPQLWGDEATRARCDQACFDIAQPGVRNDAVEDPVRQCIADNALWFNVRLPNAQEGWISAKYADHILGGRGR